MQPNINPRMVCVNQYNTVLDQDVNITLKSYIWEVTLCHVFFINSKILMVLFMNFTVSMKIPATTNVTQDFHHILIHHIKIKKQPVSVWLHWDLSPLPSTTLPPLPTYWAFCSASNVFIRKLGATKSTGEGLESKRANAGQRGSEEELWRRRNLLVFSLALS